MAQAEITEQKSVPWYTRAGRYIVHLITGGGLSQRIGCAIIFACFAFLYVLLLAPSTRTSEILYPGVSVRMSSVPDAAKSVMRLPPGSRMEQKFTATGEPIDAVSVVLSFDATSAGGMYSLEAADASGTVLGEYGFTAEGHTSPFVAALPLDGYVPAAGEELLLTLRADETNADEIGVSVVPFDEWFTHPGLRADGMERDAVLLASTAVRVDQSSAWFVFFLLCLLVCPAILCWNAPLAVNALVLILAFGCLFVFLTPINDSPDEVAHMARTFHMADGHWSTVPATTTGGDTSLYSGSIGQSFRDTPLQNMSWETKPQLGQMGANLFFLGYVPQTVGVWAGRLFGLNLAGIYYMGRLFNLLFYAVCAFFAIRMAPRFRLFLAVFSMMPMQIAISSTYNSDGLLYGLSILAAGWFIRMYYDRTIEISVRDLLLFMIPCVLVGVKQYWVAPISALPFVIPRDRFANSRTKWWCFVVVGGTLAATFLSMSYAVAHNLTGNAGGFIGEGASVPEQFEYIASAPGNAARMLAASLASGLGDNLAELFVFGRLTAPAPDLIGMIYVGFIAVVAFSTTRYQFDPAFSVGNTPSRTSTRVGVLVVNAATIIAIYLATYLTWTPVGLSTVQGVQGRYLIPIMAYLPFLSFDCWPLVTKGVYMRSRLVTGLIAVLMLAASILTISFYTL